MLRYNIYIITMPFLQRQESKDLMRQENEKKRKAGSQSPVSVAESVSTTSSPRGMKMSLLTPDEATKQINDYRSGKDVNIPSPIKEIEDERKHIHHSLVDTWTKHPEQRERLRERSDIIKKLEKDELERRQKEQEAREKAYKAYMALDPIDRPAMTRAHIHLEDPYVGYHGRYEKTDQDNFSNAEKGGLTFGGKKRKTRKNKKSKKHAKKSIKKSKKSRKTKKSNNARKPTRRHRSRRR